MQEHELKFADLNWIDENIMKVDDITFDMSLTDFTRKTNPERVILLKNRHMLETYKELFGGTNVRNILEFGTWEGGSPLFFAAATNAKKIIGIDIREPAAEIDAYVNRYRDRLRIFYNTSQDDFAKVHQAIDNEFDGPIDLIIDDASHQYEYTRRAFEIGFSRLRVGGTYVIEDWSWAHYEDPHYDDYWRKQPALTNLAFELTMGIASRSQIESMEVRKWCLIIKKGEETGRDFRLDNAIRIHPKRKFVKI